MEETEDKYLWDKRHTILYRIELSVLYHLKRERFFDLWEKTSKAIAIIGGSAVFASIVGELGLKIIAATITVTFTLALVFGFADRSKRHAELAHKFKLLESKVIERGERDFTEDDLKTWEAQTRFMEASEPPALNALVVLCQNELATASGHTDHIVHLPWYRKLLAHFVSFSARHA